MIFKKKVMAHTFKNFRTTKEFWILRVYLEVFMGNSIQTTNYILERTVKDLLADPYAIYKDFFIMDSSFSLIYPIWHSFFCLFKKSFA